MSGIMKRRFIAILITLTLVLTYMPAIAFAEGECSHENARFVAEEEPTTCEDAGHSSYWYCEDCGKYFADTDEGMDDSVAYESEEDFEIPKAHLALEHYEAEDGSITEIGQIEHWYCDACGKYFTDAEGNNEVDDSEIYLSNVPSPKDHAAVINADSAAWELALDAETAVEKANSSVASGNVAAAVNDSNAALSIARAAQNAANSAMAKAKQYIKDNADELTEDEIADLTNYVQITVDKANADVAGANSAVAAATNLKLEADRNGVYDGSLPKVKAKKPAAKKANITAKWKKLTKKQLKKSKATHYEIWVCANPGFARGQTIEKIVKKSKASLKVKGLQKKTKYYVRVRAVKYVGGVKYVGAWSQKTIKTKK